MAITIDAAAAAAPGQLVADLFVNPPVAAAAEIFARLAIVTNALRIQPDHAQRLAKLPGVVDVIRVPSWANLQAAVGSIDLLARAAQPHDLAPYFEGVSNNAVGRADLVARLSSALKL